MSRGIARRRAAKAARRKQVLAERRKLVRAATRSTLAEGMRWLAAAPLHSCLVQEGLFERGNGMVMLTRKTAGGELAIATFLVDAYCLGVKDVALGEADPSEIEAVVAASEDEAPFVSADPSYARKLLRDAVAYARSLGIEPHADYATAELLFGDASADDCEASFAFGHNGRPLYVPGPSETAAQVRRRVEQLRRRLGNEGFDFAPPADDGDDDVDDFALEDVPGYDPLEAPDPAEWLALDEDERLLRVEAYHRRSGIDVPNEKLHAVVHVVVENQIAEGEPLPVRRALERLMAEGLDRHDAVHAVGSVFAEHMYDMAHAGGQSAFPREAYIDAVETLTAESWRRRAESDDEPDRA